MNYSGFSGRKIKRRKYRINKRKIFFVFLLTSLVVLLSALISSYMKDSGESNWNIPDSQEMQASNDILDINFEETVPQEVLLHIPESELEIIKKNAEDEVSTGSYIVKKGDSLWTIAKKNKMSHYTLAKINNISPDSILRPGQILHFDQEAVPPQPDTVPDSAPVSDSNDMYVVNRGDSLWSIALKYGVYVSTLQYLNDLKSSTLSVGQKLRVSRDNVRPFKLGWDTDLKNVAQFFNASIEEILSINKGLLPDKKLNAGKMIRIPNKNPYFVNNTSTKYFTGNVAVWPVKGKIASPFGWREHPVYGKKTFHNGLDIENRRGTEVRAVVEGKVIFAEYKGNSGKLVIIQHKDGYQSIYAHLDEIKTKKGSTVGRGDIIGKVGNTGISTGPHLHFGIRKNGKFLNPINYLN